MSLRERTRPGLGTIEPCLLVGIMRQPKAPPAARVMAANALLDRGWGKAAQFVDVQGEIKQLVAVQLNVVRSDSIAHNPSAAISEQKPQAIEIIESNCSEIPFFRQFGGAGRRARQVIPGACLGPPSSPPAGAIWRGDPVKTTS